MQLLIFLILISFSKLTKAEQQLSMFGLTVHGYAVGAWSAKEMRNKISSDGTFVINPQLNYSNIKDNGDLYNYSIVGDCYGNPAIFLGKGKRYKIDNDLSFGYLLGLYMRQFPDREVFGLFRVGLYQIIPTPVIYAQHRISEKTILRIQSNALITFADIAWEF